MGERNWLDVLCAILLMAYVVMGMIQRREREIREDQRLDQCVADGGRYEWCREWSK